MAKKKLKPGEVSGYLDQIENDSDEGLYETDETDVQSSDFSEDDEYPTDGEAGEKENTNFNDDGEEIRAESTLKSYSEHDRRLDESDVEMVEEPSNEIRKETSISSTVEKISIENGESSQSEAFESYILLQEDEGGDKDDKEKPKNKKGKKVWRRS